MQGNYTQVLLRCNNRLLLQSAAMCYVMLAVVLQVPGEMFALALEAKARGMGVVGSTQNILDFISGKLAEALERPFPERLQVRHGIQDGACLQMCVACRCV